MTHAESDLAAPVTAFLAAQGWTVRSEVKDCDVAAVRGDDLLVVELKKAFTLALLVQAVRRQRLTDTVYLAVPRPGSVWQWRRANRGALHLLRRLELGLLFVSLEPDRDPVEVVLQPLPLARRRKAAARRAVLEEVNQRSADYNTAGSTRRKLVTRTASRPSASPAFSPSMARCRRRICARWAPGRRPRPFCTTMSTAGSSGWARACTGSGHTACGTSTRTPS